MLNCREAQEQGKTFHYVWLLVSILLITRELPKDSQFPNIDRDLLEVAKYASLWATKDTKWIRDIKNVWVLMKVSIRMWINRRPHLSPTVHNSLQSFADFKADMHNIYIKAWKDPTKQCMKLPFVATDDVIFMILETWPPKWRAPDLAKLEKGAAQKKKDDAKLCITQLAKRRRNEKAATKVRVAHEVA